MADPCPNKLVVFGKPEDIERFRNRSEPVSANRFIPMPEELRGIIEGGGKIDGKIVHHHLRMVDGEYDPLNQEEVSRLKEKYGAATWRDWAIRNWGTKWDFEDIKVVEATGRKVTYTFETAYEPPIPVIVAMSRQHPSLSFRLSYETTQTEFDYKGTFWCKGGTITRDRRVRFPHKCAQELSPEYRKKILDQFAKFRKATNVLRALVIKLDMSDLLDILNEHTNADENMLLIHPDLRKKDIK